MNVYITRINGVFQGDTMQYLQFMAADIGHQLGIKEMGIYRYNADAESSGNMSARMDGIIAGINRGDLIICQFPTGNGLRFECSLVNRLKAYGGRVAILLHDLEPLHYPEKRSMLWETVNLYNQAEVLIVPSPAMKQFLLGNRIRNDMKFVLREIGDYVINNLSFNTLALRNGTVFMRDGRVEEIDLDIMPGEAALNGFGLIWHENEYERRYMGFKIPFLVSRFIAAGIPVIVPEGIANQAMVVENCLGILIHSLDNAIDKIKAMDESEYQKYVIGAKRFAPSVWNGYYTKKCLIETIQAFYRKDSGQVSIPAKVCELGASVFRSTVLKESYGGNLALSWSFRGNADGFLIYDNTGNLIFKTNNTHQHYYLIKGYEINRGFIVKAYVETLKGNLIIAESALTYLDKRIYEEPQVTLVIPAYNAENFIARSIDNALAQSFSNLEIIVVDDGSTDETWKIIDWYAEKYTNVRSIHQENSGPAVARNEGIKQAKGEYIGFMDSDDMIQPDRIAGLYSSARKNDCDIAITSAYQITNNGYEVWVQYQMEEDIAVSIEEFLQNHYIQSCGFGLIVWNKMYRSSLVKEHLFPLFVGEEDVAWTPYILSYANKVCYLNDCSYEWDRIIRDSTLGIELGKKTKEGRFRCYKDVIMFYLENCNPSKKELIKKVAMTHLSNLSVWYEYPEYEKLRKYIEKKL